MIAGMIENGLRPSDPVRWWWAYALERERETRHRGGGEQDIELLEGDAALGGDQLPEH